MGTRGLESGRGAPSRVPAQSTALQVEQGDMVPPKVSLPLTFFSCFPAVYSALISLYFCWVLLMRVYW